MSKEDLKKYTLKLHHQIWRHKKHRTIQLNLSASQSCPHPAPASSPTVSSLSAQRLVGKVALVTGGATGIRECIVRLLYKHGAKVCIVDVQDNLGQLVCESLGGDPNTCFFHCDVSKEDDVRSVVDFTVNKFGTLDIMVKNVRLAGSPCPDIRNVELSELEKIFDINVKGVSSE
ncbi:hypothetical protein LWI29_031532 [Acer saccharum]|uniref:Uncharacterized protein n=1 Tax=Acer saccharum TaxID=4024 RepID=A0AA39VAH4_ACESA|nr:hypothetical protein LWI29_031532 [Acer saccharum]